ncbi:MAG: aspartate aminotransferase family protein [Desulfurococcales archaeon]|nr:aspartate aminotransferase family protein [Desulfurococcales archaeon]
MEPGEYYREALGLFPGGAPGALRRAFHKWGPLVVKSAKGARLKTVDGREFLDYHMAFGAILLGHTDPDVVEAAIAEASLLDLHGAGVTDVEVEYARMIVDLIPSAEKIVFTNSGSEAVLVAFRLARAYTGRTKILKFEGNYHGWHDYALINVSTPLARGKIPETDGVPGKVLETIDVLPYNDVEALEDYMDRHGEEVAAIILEPVAHSMGVVPAEPRFIKAVERLAKTHGALLILDEIVTAFRHNIHGLQEELGIRPDLTTVGKAVANGYPVAAVTGRRQILDLVTEGLVRTSGTYSAHPVAMAAGKAALEKIVKTRADLEAARRGEELANGLREILGDAGITAFVANYRSITTIYFGIEEQPRNLEDVTRIDKAMYELFNREMWHRGILYSPNPSKRIHLSTAHTREEIQAFLEAAASAAKSLTRPGEAKPVATIKTRRRK